MKQRLGALLACLLLLTCQACQQSCCDTCISECAPSSRDLLPHLADEVKSAQAVDERFTIQDRTRKVFAKVFDRWLQATGYSVARDGKPRIIVTSVDNNSNLFMTDKQCRDMLTTIAKEDGRFSVVVATTTTARDKDYLQIHLLNDPYYSNNSRQLTSGKALQCFASLQLSQVAAPERERAEDYLIDLTLYDIENDDLVISDWDIVNSEEKVL